MSSKRRSRTAPDAASASDFPSLHLKLTASLNDLPGVNLTVLVAAIAIGALGILSDRNACGDFPAMPFRRVVHGFRATPQTQCGLSWWVQLPQEQPMPSNPSAEPTHEPLDPAHSLSNTSSKTGSQGPVKSAKDGLLDVDLAEPVSHEHLPIRSDDN